MAENLNRNERFNRWRKSMMLTFDYLRFEADVVAAFLASNAGDLIVIGGWFSSGPIAVNDNGPAS